MISIEAFKNWYNRTFKKENNKVPEKEYINDNEPEGIPAKINISIKPREPGPYLFDYKMLCQIKRDMGDEIIHIGGNSHLYTNSESCIIKCEDVIYSINNMIKDTKEYMDVAKDGRLDYFLTHGEFKKDDE